MWALNDCDVDIILMPFALALDGTATETVNEAIKFAHKKSKVIFTCASGQGPNYLRTYPASSPYVIGIHIADGYGGDTGNNPPPLYDDDNFSTLGIAIRAYSFEKDYELELKSGPHVAAAVAAGITACLLGYALFTLQLTNPDDQRWLCSSDGVRELLRLVSSKKDGYSFIAPWMVWSKDNTAEDIRDLIRVIIQRRKTN